MSIGGTLNTVFRKGILSTTSNRAVREVVDRYGMQMGAARFVAGESLDDAVVTLKRLEDQGFKTNTALLGEHIEDEAAADQVTEEYLHILDRLQDEGLGTIISLKLSHLGLNLGVDLAYRNVEKIVNHAGQIDRFMRIDMEESWRVDDTLDIFRKLQDNGHSNVGTVLQSYLYRSMRDLKGLVEEYQPNLRIVKGAYLEGPEVAYPDKDDVDVNYLKMVKYSLAYSGYTAVATHDERIIEYVIEYTRRNEIGQDRFEFQMLYGIRTDLQRQLLQRGYKVLISTPFGAEWYPYLMRRMAERPANLLFVAKNALSG